MSTLTATSTTGLREQIDQLDERALAVVAQHITSRLDEHGLSNLARCIDARMNEIRAARIPAIAEQVHAGQCVRLGERTRPRYLQGATITIQHVNRVNVVAAFPDDDSYSTYSGREDVVIPIDWLDLQATP